jgi:hypothetical protein
MSSRGPGWESDQAAAEDDELLELPLPLDLVAEPDELEEDVEELVEAAGALDPFDDPEPLLEGDEPLADEEDDARLSVR